MKFYYDYEICKKCGGKCCKALPGAYLPKDIKNIFGTVENAIKSGIVSIGWWEEKVRKHYMRPKTTESDELYDNTHIGQYIHLKENE